MTIENALLITLIIAALINIPFCVWHERRQAGRIRELNAMVGRLAGNGTSTTSTEGERS